MRLATKTRKGNSKESEGSNYTKNRCKKNLKTMLLTCEVSVWSAKRNCNFGLQVFFLNSLCTGGLILYMSWDSTLHVVGFYFTCGSPS